jgi:Ca2+-binding EF-hand superfamily protein
MKTILFGGAAALALVAGSVAFAQAAAPAQPPRGEHRMMQTEARTEVPAHVAKMFARLDANRDGFITQAEVDTQQEQRSEKRAARFDPAKIFDRLDANKDGKVTRAEADAAHNARVAAKGSQPAEAHATAFGHLFDRADANHDGVITRAEFVAVPRPEHAGMRQAGMHHGAGGRLLETADVNKDGRASLAEVQQMALQHFDRADLNHDGKLTPEERRQSHELLKGQHRQG